MSMDYEVVWNGALARSIAVTATPQSRAKTDPQTVRSAVVAVMRDRQPRCISYLCEATGYTYQQVWEALQSAYPGIVRDGEARIAHGKPGRAKLTLYRMVV